MLHARKILTGKTISEMVTEALDAYLEEELGGQDVPLDPWEG